MSSAPIASSAGSTGGPERSRKRPSKQLGVVLAYPAADVTPLADGLLLERSALPVAERPI